MAQQLPVSLFLAACIIASFTDIRSRRVPNLLTYGAMAAIIALSATHGPVAFVSATGSSIVVLLVGSVVFGLRWLGGGDIKLLAVGAAAIGFPNFLIVLLYIACAGGVLGAAFALRERRLRTVMTSVALCAVAGSSIVPAAGSRRVPYAIAICAGSFIFAASESFVPWFRLVH